MVKMVSLKSGPNRIQIPELESNPHGIGVEDIVLSWIRNRNWNLTAVSGIGIGIEGAGTFPSLHLAMHANSDFLPKMHLDIMIHDRIGHLKNGLFRQISGFDFFYTNYFTV